MNVVGVSGAGLQRSKWLDALRGVAILLVVTWHIFPPILAHYWPLGGRFMSIGWSGVDLFFVLSGYLIGGLLLRHRGSSNYYRTFYARRFIRILPLYLVSLGIFAMMSLELPAPYYYLMAQNIVWSVQDRVAPDVTWSLALEEQFYLCLPLLVAFCSPRRLPHILVGCAIAAPLFRLTLHWLGYPHAAYMLLPARMDALSLGVLVAWAQTNALLVRPPRWLLAGTFLGGAMVLSLALLNLDSLGWVCGTIGYSVVDLFYAGVVALVVAHQPRLPTALKPFELLGLGAYSIYLFHGALLDIFQKWFGAHPEKLIGFGLAMGLVAWICRRLIERPAIVWAHRTFLYSPLASGLPRETLRAASNLNERPAPAKVGATMLD